MEKGAFVAQIKGLFASIHLKKKKKRSNTHTLKFEQQLFPSLGSIPSPQSPNPKHSLIILTTKGSNI